MLFVVSEVDLTSRTSYRIWIQDVVRYGDLDPNEHVNNGAINAYFEDGRVRLREDHLSDLGFGLLAGFVVARCSIDFLRPLHFPATVDVGSLVLRVGRSSYTLGQAIFEGERCIATAEVVTVKIDPESGRSIALVDPLKDVLRTLGCGDAT